jgi:hypothetical protein
MGTTADDGDLVITFPRAWTAAQRVELMEDVPRPAPASAGRTWAS